MGMVTFFSTSTGLAPGKIVKTFTVLKFTLGKASLFMEAMEMNPARNRKMSINCATRGLYTK